MLEEKLPEILHGARKIAMEYSPKNRLPYIGLVDAGTIEMVKSFGCEIVPSADIVANFRARLTPEQVELHREAAELVNGIKDDAFRFIADYLGRGHAINERMVAEFIMKRFRQENMTTDFPPICAIDANICNPHYDPSEQEPSPIKKNSLILIDLWAKLDRPHAVFADMTWMAYVGESVPAEYAELFKVVTDARDQTVSYLWERYKKGPIFGYQVDDVCRGIIREAGHEKHTIHRTGHSILENVHGPGPNIDNLETEDKRRLLPGHLFSIEPGIYLEEYGFRTEIDVLMTESGPEVTTQPIQQEIITLLK